MDVNQKSELIGSWTPTAGNKNAWSQAQGSQDSRPPPLGLAALPFFFLCLSLKFVFTPLTDAALSSDAD